MSSRYTERNSTWTADPAPPDTHVNRLGQSSEALMGDRESPQLAVYFEKRPHMHNIPDVVYDAANDNGITLNSWTENTNPFYAKGCPDNRLRMRGVHEDRAGELVNAINRETPLTAEVDRSQAQFKFHPVPTVGEVIIRAP